jgi:hypothetical protein
MKGLVELFSMLATSLAMLCGLDFERGGIAKKGGPGKSANDI